MRDGERVSTHDLIGRPGGFVLITGSAGAVQWQALSRTASAEVGVGLAVVSIGAGSSCTDPEGNWAAVRESADGGAILVRPDNHVAWRSLDGAGVTQDAVTRALQTCLGY